MKKSKYTESQIVAILNEADASVLVKDICRKYGISDATYCNWKAKGCAYLLSDLGLFPAWFGGAICAAIVWFARVGYKAWRGHRRPFEKDKKRFEAIIGDRTPPSVPHLM